MGGTAWAGRPCEGARRPRVGCTAASSSPPSAWPAVCLPPSVPATPARPSCGGGAFSGTPASRVKSVSCPRSFKGVFSSVLSCVSMAACTAGRSQGRAIAHGDSDIAPPFGAWLSPGGRAPIQGAFNGGGVMPGSHFRSLLKDIEIAPPGGFLGGPGCTPSSWPPCWRRAHVLLTTLSPVRGPPWRLLRPSWRGRLRCVGRQVVAGGPCGCWGTRCVRVHEGLGVTLLAGAA